MEKFGQAMARRGDAIRKEAKSGIVNAMSGFEMLGYDGATHRKCSVK